MKAEESQEKAYNGNKFHGRILEDKETVLLSIRSTENENQEKIDIRIDNENARNGLSPNIRLHTFAYCCVTHTHILPLFFPRSLSVTREWNLYVLFCSDVFGSLFQSCWFFSCVRIFICVDHFTVLWVSFAFVLTSMFAGSHSSFFGSSSLSLSVFCWLIF